MTDAPPEGPGIGRLHRRPLAQEAARQENRKERADQSLRDGKRYRVKGIPGVQDRSLETSEDAKQWLAAAKTDTRRGEFVDHWWPSRTDEPSTAGPMHSRIWKHIIPIPGDLSLRDIDASALRSFKAALLARVEDTTAEVIWGHFSSILNSAVDYQRLLRNPIKVHRSVKPPRRTEKKAKAGARSIVDAVRSHLQDRYRFAVDLGLGLGLRQGEAFGLTEDDFDFEAGVVHIRRQLRWDIKGRPYFCLPKGGKTRTVPLPLNLAAGAHDHFRRFPFATCTLPWRNPCARAAP